VSACERNTHIGAPSTMTSQGRGPLVKGTLLASSFGERVCNMWDGVDVLDDRRGWAHRRQYRPKKVTLLFLRIFSCPSINSRNDVLPSRVKSGPRMLSLFS